MKKVFIIHGWGATPEDNWFPWLKQELQKLGHQAQVPEMPNTQNPVLSKWMEKLNSVIVNPDINTYFIGHSLGVIAILRYLEALTSNQKIGGVVLVSGFSESIRIPEIENFFFPPVDFKKVKKSAGKIIVVNSDNDPYVPLKEGELIRDKLGAKFIVIKDGGHLNSFQGCLKLPIALESLLEI